MIRARSRQEKEVHVSEPQSPISNDHDSSAVQPDDGPEPPATPRWVKITGAVIALVVVAVLVKVVFGGGVSHGPGMHSGLGTSTPALAAVPGGTALALLGL